MLVLHFKNRRLFPCVLLLSVIMEVTTVPLTPLTRGAAMY